MAGMNARPCDIGVLLSAYLDGELRTGELEQVAEHLGECADCVLEFRMLKEARAAVRLLPLLEAPEWLLDEAIHLGPELSAYLDGELMTAEIPDVVGHLTTCARCRDDLLELDRARVAIRALPRIEPPEFLDAARVARSSPARSRWRVATAAAGIAAAVVLTLGVATRPAPEQTVDLNSFADRHVARASVEAGFSMLPVLAPGPVTP